MFEDAFGSSELDFERKSVRVGWPMEYLCTSLEQYRHMEKRDVILFPHRIAPEKQVDIFHDLRQSLPQYDFIVCTIPTQLQTKFNTIFCIFMPLQNVFNYYII